MSVYRTVLEQKVKERRQSVEEFAEFVETFAREHGEPGTLSARHLQRLISGNRADGAPLGPVRAVTARLLERIFGLDIDVLLSPPRDTLGTGATEVGTPSPEAEPASGTARETVALAPAATFEHAGLSFAFDWLDANTGWLPQTTRTKVAVRIEERATQGEADRSRRRSRTDRSSLAQGIAAYYDRGLPGHDVYRARCDHREIVTTVLTRPEWLDLACPLGPETDLLRLDDARLSTPPVHAGPQHAIERLAEAVESGVRFTDLPLYRLLDIDIRGGRIAGSLGLASFVEYALTMDLLEHELVDAVARDATPWHGTLSLRDRYLPTLTAALDFRSRLCVGGVVSLCAIARPTDGYRPADYTLLVQERSAQVLNAARRLAVIPKGFHEPMTDVRADARLGATLRREMEEELFGRRDVDSTGGGNRAADPMHFGRLSEPMRWLTEEPGRLQTECTGFGLNLISGNYEFASLIVIDDEDFWRKYGGAIEANWETHGLRLYSSLDRRLLAELISDESWSNEGLFALLQGLRRLGEIGGDRVDLPRIESYGKR
ncbi:hypothetical protein [Actinoalloteichus hymeniacidonis]|uniref:hypothetical protein n=1 Tax=Actinoalloteichus hymeniacidonis TaxID=340345 RepID=UPI000852B40F|nr:hypothetical protein [Actinoalloteichus hymeniacidonis]MBB5908269.1 hypothetical protein [Actinoalloteichus hymeniacidonis]